MRSYNEKKIFEVVEEYGVVIYDESDDYCEDELWVEDEKVNFRLMSNEEIFTDEYMQEFSRKMDAEIEREKRTQRWISVGVILGCILWILFIIWAVLKLHNV